MFPIGVLSVFLGASLVSASNSVLISSTQGKNMVLLSTTTTMNKDGDHDDDKNRVNASGTIKIYKENDNEIDEASSSNKDNDENFEINGDEERRNDNRGFLISEMAQVHTGGDLHLFVQSIVHKNTEITEVETKDDRVSVTRIIPVKIFGFISASSTENILVISWGNGTSQIIVNRPWWDIFSTGEVTKDKVSTDLESKIKNIPSAEFRAKLDTATKARILSEIQAVLIANGFASTTIK